MRKLFLLLICIIFLFTACGKKEAVKGVESSVNEAGDVRNIKITAQNANIRSGCSAGSDVLQTAGQNDRFEVLSKVSNWYAVQLPDNSIGFIPEKQAKPVVSTGNGGNNSAGTDTGSQAGTGDNATTGQNTGTTGTQQNNQGTTKAPGTTAKNTTAKANNGGDAANTTNGLSGDEQKMLELINQERAANGVPALKADNSVANVARIKSKDMIDNNYFSHNSPTYGSPFDMMKNFNIEYVKAGENIAGNQTVQAAHDALMKSPGHRENILNPEYTHVGIGIQEGGQYGMMFTQMFVAKPE